MEALYKEECDRLASLHSFCAECTDRTSQLSYWLTAVAMVTEEEFASIAYLKTAAPSVDQLYYNKFFIRLVALYVTNVDI